MTLKLMWEDRYRFISVMIFSAAVSLLSLVPYNYLGSAVDGFDKGILSIQDIARMLSIIALTTIVFYVVSSARTYYTFIGLEMFTNKVSRMIMKKIIRKNPSYFDEMSVGEIMSRISTDTKYYYANFFAYGYYCMGYGVLNILIFFVYISYKTNIFISFLISISFMFQVIHTAINKHKYEGMYKKMQEYSDKISEKTLESIKGVRIVRAYNMLGGIRKEYLDNLSEYAKKNLEYVYTSNRYQTINILASAITYLIFIVYGYHLYVIGQASFGSLLTVSLLIPLLKGPYFSLSGLVIVIFEAIMGGRRIQEIIDSVDAVENPNGKVINFKDSIEFKNFSFGYDDKLVLKNINLKINKGETVGIIGKTGSGKTTLVKNILRLYPSKNIYLDDVEINEYSVKSVRGNIGYVPQEYMLFSKTIRENILVFRPLEDKLDFAIDMADLGKDISKFNKGIDTLVGENGISLSGGQKQRIAIARAIISNPKILIMDDSMSALDSNTAKNIASRIKEKRTGMTNILISHRISSISYADKIVVLNDGVIENVGTHKELLVSCKWYKELYDYQSREGDKNEK